MNGSLWIEFEKKNVKQFRVQEIDTIFGLILCKIDTLHSIMYHATLAVYMQSVRFKDLWFALLFFSNSMVQH